MLAVYLHEGAVKRTATRDPLVDYDAQQILVAGRARLALHLLRGHVGNGAGLVSQIQRCHDLRNTDDAEVEIKT